MKNIFKQTILCIGLISLAFSQEIPNEFLEFQVHKLLTDAGQNWGTNSSFGLPRFQSVPKAKPENIIKSDSLNIRTRTGIFTKNGAIAFYGFGHFSFKKHFYGYLYPRIVNDPDTFIRYSGVPRDITRGGFNSGETDLSGIGFQNDWLTLQLGRGRESWGAGNEIQLALSENSPAYDYGMLGLDFGRLRAKYIHGFLESTENDINRYITARGIEWTNRKSLVIGLSETVIYSGEDRPLDIGYINPISTHLEIELNDRLNTLGTGSANAVWQISGDWLINQKLRISANYLFDEFVLDKIEFDNGKEHGKAYSGRISYTPIMSETTLLTTYFSLLTVGTPTFRHGNGYNNFVQRNKPLGWQYGSDGQEFKLGLNYFNRTNLIAQFEFGQRKTGEESITSRPYDPYADYLAGPFPSGIVEESLFITSKLQWWWRPSIQLNGGVDWDDNGSLQSFIGINIYFPRDFTF
ncbi:MAG: hypothetical protein HOK59_09800 [Candidatus Marinimicrobia bacterium]|nr:hypothetical protein [Candidatus Neomarinimicrobiota bacterium]